MKIGYPCINRSVGCTPNKTFRLASYSEEKITEIIQLNLNCLKKTLKFNVKNDLLFFRIGSPLIPFASHPVCKFDWQNYFKKEFQEIGNYLKKHKFRISMHPDQFVLINAIKEDIVEKSIKELEYHCDVLDLLGLDESAKVQIHVGGVYGDKNSAMNRFIETYNKLSPKIKKRLAIENDHLSYGLKDCLKINKETNVPIIFDFFHHECLNNGENLKDAAFIVSKTWNKKDGIMMADYSLQKPKATKGSHAENIDIKKFKKFIKYVEEVDFDLMLEIKDKEKSALKAIKCLKERKK
jgi:UV DNA damage endonuclease